MWLVINAADTTCLLLRAKDFEKTKSLMSTKTRHKSYFMPQASVCSLRWNLENVFGSVKVLGISSRGNDHNDGAPESIEGALEEGSFRLMNCVTVKRTDGFVELEWLESALADFVADAAAVVLMALGRSSRSKQPQFSPSGASVVQPSSDSTQI